MGLFSRNNPFDDDDSQDHIDRAKREYSEREWIKHAHNKYDTGRANQPEPSGHKGATPSSGPSCNDASTPKRGRRW